MTHSTEYLKETLRSRAGRRSAVQPSKAKEHRYERRKIRQLMRFGEWQEAEG